MGFMDKFSKDKTPVPAQAPTQQTAPTSGTVNLTKGGKVSLAKTASQTIVASNGWTAKGKDYDLKALVRYRDGRQVYVGAANSDEVLATKDGAVRHGGDVKEPGDMEEITIAWNADIASVALSSYSALENGTGSFRKYGVFVNIDNSGQVITLNAADTSADGNSYTLCFGEVVFDLNGGFTVSNLEMYSQRGSERRIGYQGDRVMMDIGPEGRTK